MNHCQSHDASTVLIQMGEFILFVMHAGAFQNCPNIKVVSAPDVVVAGVKGRKRKSKYLKAYSKCTSSCLTAATSSADPLKPSGKLVTNVSTSSTTWSVAS